MKIIIAILIFSFIIIFHEMGHYLVAKKCDVKVNEFQLGLGPRIFGIPRGETMFSVHLFPFGGACVMEGEDEASDDERAFSRKTVWQRAAIVVAGPLFNFILAYVIAIIIIGVMGFDPPVLSGTMDGYPAQEAGLKEGDEILKLNHYRTHFYREVSVYMYMHPGQPVNVTYKRDGNKYKTTIVPKLDEETGRYLMGVQGTNKREKGGIFTTLRYGLYEIKYQVYITFESLKMLITRKVSLNEVSGPVGIVKIIGDIYEASAPDGLLYVMMNLFSISVLLSANLGVMNLLPIPALDGGRLLIYIVEIIRGRRMSEDLENKINIVGFAVLMMLMLVILANDIIKLVHI